MEGTHPSLLVLPLHKWPGDMIECMAAAGKAAAGRVERAWGRAFGDLALAPPDME
jgi:hypothetical protein